MPTYEYRCLDCGFELEELQSMSEPPLTLCPQCGHESLARGIGGGAGLIFKGTGFYLTDYKKSSSPPPVTTKKSGEKETPGKSEEKSTPETKETKPKEPPATRKE